MKNKTFFLNIAILPFFFIFTISAQIGITGAVGVSDIAFLKFGQTPYLGYEINSLEHRIPLVSYQLGVSTNLDLGKRIELQPELLFTAQGLDYNTEYLYDDITYKIKINYLKLPVLLTYNFGKRNKTQSTLLLGPYASWKLRAVRITEIEGEREKVKVSNMKDGDLGIVAGYSFGINMPSRKINFGLRGSFSLINMMNPIPGHVPKYNGPSKEYARNIVICLTMGYQFKHLFSKKTDNK